MVKSRNGTVLRIRFERNHFKPHFHLEYKTEYRASYSLPECLKLAGYMPRVRERDILAWARVHVDELKAEWTLQRVAVGLRR